MKNLASPWQRLIAGLIDELINLNLWLFVLVKVASESEISKILTNFLNLVLILILGGLLTKLLNTLLTCTMGGSVGKLVSGLEVVDGENRKVTFGRAVLRNYVGYLVSGIFVWLGFIWIWKDEKHQGWHDMIAGTYVLAKNTFGLISGIVVAIALAVTTGYLVMNLTHQITIHLPVYKQIYTDIQTELKPTPTPGLKIITP